MPRKKGKAIEPPTPKATDSTSTFPEKKSKSDAADDFWLNAEELPAEGNIYGGLVLLPDGRRANVYMEMGKTDIATLEATISDVILTEEELQQEVTAGTRTMTLKRYIFEEIIPHYYNQKKGKS